MRPLLIHNVSHERTTQTFVAGWQSLIKKTSPSLLQLPQVCLQLARPPFLLLLTLLLLLLLLHLRLPLLLLYLLYLYLHPLRPLPLHLRLLLLLPLKQVNPHTLPIGFKGESGGWARGSRSASPIRVTITTLLFPPLRTVTTMMGMMSTTSLTPTEKARNKKLLVSTPCLQNRIDIKLFRVSREKQSRRQQDDSGLQAT